MMKAGERIWRKRVWGQKTARGGGLLLCREGEREGGKRKGPMIEGWKNNEKLWGHPRKRKL